jgi:hypothetical protein
MARYIHSQPRPYSLSVPEYGPPEPWFEDPPGIGEEPRLFAPLRLPTPPTFATYEDTLKMAELIRAIDKLLAEDMWASSTDPYPREEVVRVGMPEGGFDANSAETNAPAEDHSEDQASATSLEALIEQETLSAEASMGAEMPAEDISQDSLDVVVQDAFEQAMQDPYDEQLRAMDQQFMDPFGPMM